MNARFLLIVCALSSCACASARTRPDAWARDDAFPGLVACQRDARPASLRQGEAVTVLVHGCKSSPGLMENLAHAVEASGRRAVCFAYDDRAHLQASAQRLAAAISWIERRAQPRSLVVLGHSQGGLVARRALTTDLRPASPGSTSLKLVTVSAPFHGVEAARACRLPFAREICRLALGDKWSDLIPGSGFLQHPGTLARDVSEHLEVVTDERGACGRVGTRRACDRVFTLAEQRHPEIDAERRSVAVSALAGHTEIIGERAAPDLLASILEERGLACAGEEC